MSISPNPTLKMSSVARAKALVKDAQKRSASLVSDAEERMAKIRIEREAVAGYFESLRSVLTEAEKITAD